MPHCDLIAPFSIYGHPQHPPSLQAMHNTGRAAALFDRLTPTTFTLPKEAAAFQEAYVRALHGVEPTCVQVRGRAGMRACVFVCVRLGCVRVC